MCPIIGYPLCCAAAQDAQRYANFVSSVRRIIANNKDASTAHWSGLNEFSALSDQEFRAQLSASLERKDTTPAPAPVKASRSLLQTLPAVKNWAAEGKVTGVRNQLGVSVCSFSQFFCA